MDGRTDSGFMGVRYKYVPFCNEIDRTQKIPLLLLPPPWGHWDSTAVKWQTLSMRKHPNKLGQESVPWQIITLQCNTWRLLTSRLALGRWRWQWAPPMLAEEQELTIHHHHVEETLSACCWTSVQNTTKEAATRQYDQLTMKYYNNGH